jgi:hypothetical protein
MTNVLLIDFGATHIKSVVINKKTKHIGPIFISPGSSSIGTEVKNIFFSDSMKLHLKQGYKKYKISAIMMCCEMHGFSYKTNNNISNYFSWRFFNGNEEEVIKKINKKQWFKNLRIHPRPGIPLISLLAIAKQRKLPKKIKILFIPQIICENLGFSYHKTHVSLGHASGLYIDKVIFNNLLNTDINLPEYTDDSQCCVGKIKYRNDYIPVYGGYGDLQASLYDIPLEDWNINIGTGSQIVVNTKNILRGFEKRAFFNGKSIQCVSHIPAGRSLNIIADLFKSIRGEKNNNYFWDSMKKLKYIKQKNNMKYIKINLNFFEQNNNFSAGGFIKDIYSSNLNVHAILYGTVYSMVNNYGTIINKVKRNNNDLRINIYGDLLSKIPLFKKLLIDCTGLQVVQKNNEKTQTLKNMKKICLDYDIL